MKSDDTSINKMISEAHQKIVDEDRHYIKTVAEILLFIARQDNSQRGHREGQESKNRGNFLELMKLISYHDPIIAKKCIDLPQNAKYTSPQIQNEVLEILADIIRKQITEEVKICGQYAVIVHESKDI